MTTPSKKFYSREEALARKNAGMKLYRLKNPERAKELDKKFYDAHREERIAHVTRWVKSHAEQTATTQRKCHLKAMYGLTVEEWHSIFQKQGARCAICGRTEIPGKNPWHTDHDHKNGRVRGILCKHCNVVLGMAKDDPKILLAAIDYLIERP